MKELFKPQLAVRAAALAGVLGLGTLFAYGLDTRFDIDLLVPSAGLKIAPEQTASVAQTHLETFVIEVVPRVGHVRYGSMRVKIGEESAAIYTTVSGTEEGYRCEVQLKPNGTVTLKPGDNLVALEFSDTWNQPHRVVFHVVLQG